MDLYRVYPKAIYWRTYLPIQVYDPLLGLRLRDKVRDPSFLGDFYSLVTMVAVSVAFSNLPDIETHRQTRSKSTYIATIERLSGRLSTPCRVSGPAFYITDKCLV
jgi:hypothetical protein